jgi:hypothetical protein
MNTNQIKVYIAENEWVKVAGYTLAGILGLSLVYGLLVQPHARRLASVRIEVEHMHAKAQQYNNFSPFRIKLDQQRELVNTLSTSFGSNYFVNNQSENNFLDEVGNLCQQANIKLDHISPTKIDTGQAWAVGFVTHFWQMNSFLLSLEKYFKIESLRIQKGDAAGNRVDMVIVPVIVAGNADGSALNPAKAKQDIFDLFSATEEIVKRVQQKQAEIGSNAQVQRNPFNEESAPKIVTVPRQPQVAKPVVEAPPISLDSIFWDPETPVAVINGKAMREGETIKDVTISKIQEDGVTVEWKGHKHTLKVTKKETK